MTRTIHMIDLEQELKDVLLQIQNPARYVGGEFHYGKKDESSADFYAAICFPDLYEIGMSNNAVRILYDLMNRNSHVLCDRVFSVAPDFEEVLRERNMPLFTLDKRIPLHELDFLGISIGYELAATNILQVLDLGKIPLHVEDRTDDHPIVICGGPAATNPLPFAKFIDFVYIGEAENGMNELIEVLRDCKNRGASRSEKIEALNQFDFLWYPGKKLALRSVDNSFSKDEHVYEYYVVPNFKVAQDNGVVEIMRGCPNGCRFCHAGQYYKPYRQKNYKTIRSQVEQNVHGFGYREVTLSSLSSGDHPYIKEMIEQLNSQYAPQHVSFSLPSLKVSSFSLGVLEQLSEVRKSGLTFAIETPLVQWQRALNKEVPVETVIEIIREAKKRGWKLAKFYFMVGLPFSVREEEQQAIVDFLGQIYDATRISMNINIGTFIPKAHTPYQWCAQLNPEIAGDHLRSIKRAINDRIRGCKVSYHEPDISYIEGLISRGDERAWKLIEAAYNKGCRLDAWDEHLKKELWYEAIEELDYDIRQFIFTDHSLDEQLPWSSVSMRVGDKFMENEYLRAKEAMLTTRCEQECGHLCGVCGKHAQVVDMLGQDQPMQQLQTTEGEERSNLLDTFIPPQGVERQVLFTYSRTGRALFISHISIMRNFEMAFQRSGLNIQFTQGFNPKPRLEFVNPLSVGMQGDHEVMMAELLLPEDVDKDAVCSALQASLTDGFLIEDMLVLDLGKKTSMAKHMAGSKYTISNITDTDITSRLESIPQETADYQITRQGVTWHVSMKGEKNLVKLLFGNDVDKFKLCSHCQITRTGLYAGDMDTLYLDYFKQLNEQASKID